MDFHSAIHLHEKRRKSNDARTHPPVRRVTYSSSDTTWPLAVQWRRFMCGFINSLPAATGATSQEYLCN